MYKIYRNVFTQDNLVEIVHQFNTKSQNHIQDDDVFNRNKLSVSGDQFKGPYVNNLREIVLDANTIFNLDIFDPITFEKWNLSTYEQNGFCADHNDIVKLQDVWQRKLTVIIEITRRCDGANLEMTIPDVLGESKDLIDLLPGDAVVFPSYVNHSVSKITNGTRQSLTGWVTGPPLK